MQKLQQEIYRIYCEEHFLVPDEAEQKTLQAMQYVNIIKKAEDNLSPNWND